jgi:2-phospho-L-lactate guanylyltransferase
VIAVVVARTGMTAKRRLSGELSPPERAQLALVMLDRVLTACDQAQLDGVILVTDTPAGAQLGARHGARTLADAGEDLNAAVLAGLEAAAGAGADTVVVLPGDVPLVAPSDIRALVEAVGQAPRALAVAPDRAGIGTNALLLRPPLLIQPAFGPGSCRRHIEAGQAAGAVTVEVHRTGLAVDIDTPADLPVPRNTAPALFVVSTDDATRTSGSAGGVAGSGGAVDDGLGRRSRRPHGAHGRGR